MTQILQHRSCFLKSRVLSISGDLLPKLMLFLIIFNNYFKLFWSIYNFESDCIRWQKHKQVENRSCLLTFCRFLSSNRLPPPCVGICTGHSGKRGDHLQSRGLPHHPEPTREALPLGWSRCGAAACGHPKEGGRVPAESAVRPGERRPAVDGRWWTLRPQDVSE